MQEYCNGMTIGDEDYHTISEPSVSSMHLQLNVLFPTAPIQAKPIYFCFPRTLEFEAMPLTVATGKSVTETYKNC